MHEPREGELIQQVELLRWGNRVLLFMVLLTLASLIVTLAVLAPIALFWVMGIAVGVSVVAYLAAGVVWVYRALQIVVRRRRE